jgi:hypothetical protein
MTAGKDRHLSLYRAWIETPINPNLEESMDITITMNEAEIVTAIKDFLNTQDVPTVGKEVEVNMVAGRGANGHSAVITIKKEELVSLLEPVVEPPVVVPAPDVTPVAPVITAEPEPSSVLPPRPTGVRTRKVKEPVVPTEPVTESLFDENNVSEAQTDSLFEVEEIVDPELTEEELAVEGAANKEPEVPAISGSLFD